MNDQKKFSAALWDVGDTGSNCAARVNTGEITLGNQRLRCLCGKVPGRLGYLAHDNFPGGQLFCQRFWLIRGEYCLAGKAACLASLEVSGIPTAEFRPDAPPPENSQ